MNALKLIYFPIYFYLLTIYLFCKIITPEICDKHNSSFFREKKKKKMVNVFQKFLFYKCIEYHVTNQKDASFFRWRRNNRFV